MGNQISNLFNSDADDTTKLKPASVKQIIDYIATYYILTMDFQSLRKLYDIEYCDKLVILTSDIIERYFTDIQITYLAENIKNGKNGVEENRVEENRVEENRIEKDNMIFFNKDDISKLDIKNPVKKRRVCIGIAKYYIKIAHVFATILTTINPTYIYKDENGDKVKADIYNRNKIPKDAEVEILNLNICDNRIDALKRGSNVDFSKDLEDDEEIKIHPKMCSFNLKHKDANDDDDDDEKDLEDEPGIPELMELYYDDEYDYETGKFRGMKPETQELFNENLANFYNVFMETEGKPMPDNIKKFSDIKLKNYNKKEKCRGKYPAYDSSVKGTIKDDLFKQYAENLKQMLNKAKANQELLLDVLNKLFVYMTDPQTKKKIIRINPELTEELLQETVLETRAIIINLYLTCETDFANGIKIYEAIVDKKIIDTAKSQIETMEKTREALITEDEIPKPAELRELKTIADKKIQKQKEELAAKEVKIQNEQEKIDLNVKPIVDELKVKEEAAKEAAKEKAAKEKEEAAKEAIKEQVQIEEGAEQPPMVKVKINVQGQGEEQVKEMPAQILGGNTRRKNKKKYKNKSMKLK
jgi:hypothetical protein